MSGNFNPGEFLSPAAKRIPPSGIRKFFDIVNETPDAISLGVGEPDFVTPWHIRAAAIDALKQGHTYYTSNWGIKELRKEIAAITKRKYNLSYNPDNEIIVTVGGSEAVDLCIRALVSSGDEVVVAEPSFVCYKPSVELIGGRAVPLVTTMKDNFKITVEGLKKTITPKTKLLIMSYPNNPTGAIMDSGDLKKIADYLKDKNIMVLSDEIYSELTYSGKHHSIAEFEGMKEKTVVINGFSKSYAMTGFRLGYVMGHKDIISAMVKIHQYEIMSAPTMSQYAGIEALRYGDDDILRMKKEYDMRRRVLVDALNNMGLSCFEPLGAFYVFPSITSTGMDSETFCKELLLKEKTAVVPGNAFGDSGEGHIRISYAYSLEAIKKALARIERFVSSIK